MESREQTALRPRPMPGQEHGGEHGPVRRPPVPRRRRGRRLAALAGGVLAGIALILSGVGLATVAGTSRPATTEPRPRAGAEADVEGRTAATPAAAPVPVRPTLGLEVVDDDRPGARVVGVHVPGPGYTAGLVRGDVLVTFAGTRLATATDLARAVAASQPGRAVPLTVLHTAGTYQQLTVTPGIVT
ncbi:PDZ domain-containing protein [Streptomyces sp. NPDC088817]|uniref:PDZ domain-containing protein n=1 Tax=unclassified Streptomyces TaxID=2593676 RepID=UPI0038071BAB